MPHFTFDDFARTTLGAATNEADGSPLSSQQMDRLINYLKAPGSGPDSTGSYAEFLEAKLSTHPARLPPGIEYIGFSGTDSTGISNFFNAATYAVDVDRKAGLIGDTPWGKYITSLEDVPEQHPDFIVIKGKLESFMHAEGVKPYRDSHDGALRDMMWNAGSPQYFENAIATGKPLIVFVENAPANRGFSNFELTTALQHPDSSINGYPVSAFGQDPLGFVSKSATEYKAFERSLAEHATNNGPHPVDVAKIRLEVKPIDGYDAVNQLLFDRPVDDFKTLTLDDMKSTRADWTASRVAMSSGPRPYPDAPEHLSQRPTESGRPRGPPGALAAEAVAGAGVSPGMKVAGVAGMALLAHDFATSGHKWVELSSSGNSAGADSTAAHFIGRNAGGALGGFIAGAGVGMTTGSWTGPGALVTGIGGGALGAYLGERWADQRDIDRVYIQEDTLGRTWTQRPGDPEGRWLRGAEQQQVQSSDLGNGVEVRPVQTALGDDVTYRASYVASGTLERYLDWKAAKASYELGLANPPPAHDPYRLAVKDEPGAPRVPFETERAFVRDPMSRQWELEIKTVLDSRTSITRHEPVSPEQAQVLDEQSRTVIAQNAANTPAAMAARYMVAHEQGRWSDFGDKDNPSIPSAIQDARSDANTLKASDGDRYTRQDDGQWRNNGVLYDSTASPNLSEELNGTWQSQQEGIAGLNAMGEQLRASMQPAREGIHGQVAALYERHGIERTEEQLSATTAAVEQGLASNGSPQDLVLELMADPRTHAPGAESAIAAFSDAGGGRMVLTASITMEDVAKIQSLHQEVAPAAVVGGHGNVATLETVTVTPHEPSLDGRDRADHENTVSLSDSVGVGVAPFSSHEQKPQQGTSVPGYDPTPDQAQPTKRPAATVQTHEEPAASVETTGYSQAWPTNPDHRDYPLLQQIRGGVAAVDAEYGRTFDATSERMSANLFVLAKGQGLNRADHVVMSSASAGRPEAEFVFVVEGSIGDPAGRRASMHTQQAVETSVEQAMQQFAAQSQDHHRDQAQRMELQVLGQQSQMEVTARER